MKNVLYIGPYRESSSIGNASRKYIQSLNDSKCHLSIKPFYNTFKTYDESHINKNILNLENNSIENYETIIQHVYPHQLCYNSYFKNNIGILHPECLDYGLDYINYTSQMTALIVPSEFSKRSLVSSGIDQNKIYTIPVPLDTIEIDSFKSVSKKLNKDKYTFYVIDEFINKSNIDNVILAYLILLSKYENIELIIKIEQSNNYSENSIKEIINNIYNIFSINNKSIPTIIIGDTDYSRVLDLHNNGDCLIDISTGKSFGYSILEAMAFNNNIIALNDTAQSELVDNGSGYVIDNEYINCLDDSKMYFMYNTMRQIWSKPILNDLINTMEKVILESDTNRKNRIKNQDEIIKLYTIKQISELFEKII
jgi:glycosyltransferase involved in cell wall biosynthesis